MNIRRRDQNERRGIQRRDPFQEMMSRFFGDAPFGPFENLATETSLIPENAALYPKIDMSEDDKNITVRANVPGIDPKEINVEIGDDYLTLSGKIEREDKQEDEEKKYYRYEREFGEFRRDIQLPSKVDTNNVTATTKNGVLTITLPKQQQESRKKIEITGE